MSKHYDFDYDIPPDERVRGNCSDFTKKMSKRFGINEKNFEESLREFEVERAALKKAMKEHLSRIRGTAILTAFLEWVKTAPYYSLSKTDYQMMLLDSELIPFFDEDDQPLVISQLPHWFFPKIIEEIRCEEKFHLEKKERLVEIICDFAAWLYEETFLSVFKITDPDLSLVHHRTLQYRSFITFLSHLEGKYQLIAMLMYFGGKSLSQILSLSVQDIDFSKNQIVFDDVWVKYPTHVIRGLKPLVGERTHGKVFAGREAKELNTSTVFRNFKTASIKAHLGDDFTPKDLYKRKETQ